MIKKFVSFLLPALLLHCAQEANFLEVSEEFIQNALFQNTREIRIMAPTSDSVKPKSSLTFQLKPCGSRQIVAVAHSRLIVSEGQLSNWEYAGVAMGRIDSSTNSDGNLEIAPDSLMQVKDGETLTEPFDIAPGRWYWASWSFTQTGEIECSSSQSPFFVR